MKSKKTKIWLAAFWAPPDPLFGVLHIFHSFGGNYRIYRLEAGGAHKVGTIIL